MLEPVYKSEVFFAVCEDGTIPAAYLKKKYDININYNFEGLQGCCIRLQNKTTHDYVWFVWVTDCKNWKTMVHEASHLTFQVMDVVQIKCESGNDEAWCYLHEYFVSQFWKVMCKGRKK